MESDFSGKFVDAQNGTISREIFVNREVYDAEQERIFAKTWQFVGHESQVPKTGDFFVSRMGEEPVIMARDSDGSVRVFLNTCRHRGMRVCRYDEGNTPVFTCPYHGWSYGLDGGLRGVPRYKDAYFGELDKSKWGLHPARVSEYRGTIWATWSEQAPSLPEYLGAATRVLDAALEATDGSDAKTVVLGGVQKWRVPANWKFVSENFAGDFYHNPSHVSVELTGIGPDSVSGSRPADYVPTVGHRHGGTLSLKEHITSIPSLGHGWGGAFLEENATTDAYPYPTFADEEVENYFREAHASWRRLRGNETPGWVRVQPATIFPNMSFHMRFPRSIIVAHPDGPTSTELWRWYIVDENMPTAVQANLRKYYLRYSGPAGMTEQDDMENWGYATAASRGTIARRLDYCYQQGLGRWSEHPEDPSMRVSDTSVSEANALSFYGRWTDFMEGKAW